MGSFKTHIEIEVEVFYDYDPFEEQTRTDPHHDAQVTVSAVEIALPEGSVRVGHYPDISNSLTKEISASLEEQCFENEANEHERSS